MRTVLAINSKGGCGKTTVTTNLASYYAAAGARVAVKDYDPQGSTLQWLKSRPAHLPRIHGANAAPQKGHLLKSLQTWLPGDTELQFLDAPGGVTWITRDTSARRILYQLIRAWAAQRLDEWACSNENDGQAAWAAAGAWEARPPVTSPRNVGPAT